MRKELLANGWPCACVRRGKRGNLEAIRIQSFGQARCRSCGARRPEQGKYYCAACGQLVARESDKRWLMSFCDRTGRMTRLYRV
jgi:hypothetical protein